MFLGGTGFSMECASLIESRSTSSINLDAVFAAPNHRASLVRSHPFPHCLFVPEHPKSSKSDPGDPPYGINRCICIFQSCVKLFAVVDVRGGKLIVCLRCSRVREWRTRSQPDVRGHGNSRRHSFAIPSMRMNGFIVIPWATIVNATTPKVRLNS